VPSRTTRIRYYRTNETVSTFVQLLEFSKSIPQWTGRPSNKTPAPATCWWRH